MKKRTIIIIIAIALFIALAFIFIRTYEIHQSTDCYTHPDIIIQNGICIGIVSQVNKTLDANLPDKECNIRLTGSQCLGIKILLSQKRNG